MTKTKAFFKWSVLLSFSFFIIVTTVLVCYCCHLTLAQVSLKKNRPWEVCLLSFFYIKWPIWANISISIWKQWQSPCQVVVGVTVAQTILTKEETLRVASSQLCTRKLLLCICTVLLHYSLIYHLNLERWHVHRLSLILWEHRTNAMLIHFMITVGKEKQYIHLQYVSVCIWECLLILLGCFLTFIFAECSFIREEHWKYFSSASREGSRVFWCSRWAPLLCVLVVQEAELI